MAVRRETVVLCRGSSENNETQEAYVQVVTSAGYACDYLKTIRFEFLNIANLREYLLKPESYYGLILTSRRAVEAINLAAKENENLLQPWKYLPAYCVGPATESSARNSLSLQNCLGSDSGNAKELAEKIIASVTTKSKPLLYPCSQIARDTLEQSLSSKGIHLQKLVTYKTLASETLEFDLLQLIENSQKIFVFFSPSTVTCIMSALKNQPNKVKNIKAVAIGPVTGEALTNAGLYSYAIADKPEPAALIKAIIEADKCKNLEKGAYLYT